MLRIWREQDTGMIAGRFRLADVDGVLIEKVFLELTEKMRPAPGQAWDSLEHRQADALMQLCRDYSDVEVTQRTRSRPQIVFHHRHDGTIDCDGIPIAPETVTALLDQATAKLRLEDPHGTELHTTRTRRATPVRRDDPEPIDGLGPRAVHGTTARACSRSRRKRRHLPRSTSPKTGETRLEEPTER